MLLAIRKTRLESDNALLRLELENAVSGNGITYAFKFELLAGDDFVVIGRIYELERYNAEINQVGAVDAFDRLRENGLYAEIHRAERRVFAARALTVTFARDDNVYRARRLVCEAVVVELRIARLEDELRVLRDVRAELEARAGGHDVVGRDFIADLDRAYGVLSLSKLLALRNLGDIGSAYDLRGSDALSRCGAVKEH